MRLAAKANPEAKSSAPPSKVGPNPPSRKAGQPQWRPAQLTGRGLLIAVALAAAAELAAAAAAAAAVGIPIVCRLLGAAEGRGTY